MRAAGWIAAEQQSLVSGRVAGEPLFPDEGQEGEGERAGGGGGGRRVKAKCRATKLQGEAAA